MKKIISIIILVSFLYLPSVALASKDSFATEQNARLDSLEKQVATLQAQISLYGTDVNLTNKVDSLENRVIAMEGLLMRFQNQIIEIQKMLINFITTISTKLRTMQ